MRTFRPSFPTQTTEAIGQRLNGAAAAIHAISAQRIDARARSKGGYLRRFCRRRNFVRQCSRVILADSSLKTELSGVLKGGLLMETRIPFMETRRYGLNKSP
jgi:hypothetical protein